jgi:predicted ester cyclase
MTRDEVIRLIERLHHIWSTGEYAAIPEVYTEDFVGHMSKESRLGDLKGHAGVEGAIRIVRAAIPDFVENVVDMVVDGDKAVTRYFGSGVHVGPYFDIPPSGQLVLVDEISIFHTRGNRVAEQWCMGQIRE